MTARRALIRPRERVLIARAEGDAAALAEILGRRGYRAETFAAIRTRPPRRRQGLERAAARAEHFTDIVFASRAAVEAFAEALARNGRRAGNLSHVRIVAIGMATATAARASGFQRAVRPREASGRGVLAMFSAKGNPRDRRILLPAAADGRREIADGLRAMGARVTRVEAYRTVLASRMPVRVRRALDAGRISVVVFASPSGVAAFVNCSGPMRLRRLAPSLPVVAIGATTADALRNAGFERVTVSPRATPEALGAVVARVLSQAPVRRRSLALRSIDKPRDDS